VRISPPKTLPLELPNIDLQPPSLGKLSHHFFPIPPPSYFPFREGPPFSELVNYSARCFFSVLTSCNYFSFPLAIILSPREGITLSHSEMILSLPPVLTWGPWKFFPFFQKVYCLFCGTGCVFPPQLAFGSAALGKTSSFSPSAFLKNIGQSKDHAFNVKAGSHLPWLRRFPFSMADPPLRAILKHYSQPPT